MTGIWSVCVNEFHEVNQIGFVTSLEVARDLVLRDLLSADVYSRVEQIVLSRLAKDDGDEHFGEMVFPVWQDCRELKWLWDEPQQPTSEYQRIRSIILEKCGV